MQSKEYPLILVCYIDSEVMKNQEIMNNIANNFNLALTEKEANAMAFFVPTTTEERIECINPVIASPEQLKQIDTLIGDLKTNFDIGTKLSDE